MKVKPDGCSCLYPEQIFKNMSGHRSDCPIHKKYINIWTLPKIKCAHCGKFLSEAQVEKIEFTPDTHFTSEKTEYICKKCNEVNNQ